MDEYKVKQLRKMAGPRNQRERGALRSAVEPLVWRYQHAYHRHGLKALIHYYEKHNTDLGGTDDE